MSSNDRLGTASLASISRLSFSNEARKTVPTTRTASSASELLRGKYGLDIDQIVELAHLYLTDEEKQLFSTQLLDTLDYIEQLNKSVIDTSNIEPTHSVTGLSNVMRPDETEPSLSQQKALQNTKSKSDGYFKVKAIFDES